MAKYLVIVESPAKVKTIKKFLGSNYEVAASNGHVRDLPKSTMGIGPEDDFEPHYITIRGKGDVLANLRKEAKKADKIYLATDPDREGEAISWHLSKALKLEDKDINRITFNEITKNAVKESFKHTRKIDMNLVDAQQSRRILDRMVGYKISPLLWAKVKRGLSAGRVQSVALRIICQRENEINEFVPEEYWTLDASFTAPKSKKPVVAKFYGDDSGKININNEDELNAIMKKLKNGKFMIKDIKKGERIRKSPLPFTTSTLQQEASKVLNFTTQKTMRIAQSLYEGVDIKGVGQVGIITYLRTDSTRVADEAVKSAHEYITENFGEKYAVPGVKKVDSKNIQDAHEAIRPTDISLTPTVIKESLSRDEFRLYQLIWKRFVASQMSNAVYETTQVRIEGGSYIFTSGSSKLSFDGFMSVYVDNDEEKEENNAVLNSLKEGENLTVKEFEPVQHFTQPPAHFTEASLVKALEELGIGRPSTYAPTITTILARRYVIKENKSLYVTELGEAVDNIMVKAFPSIVDVNFTANLETLLDKVGEGVIQWKTIVRNFYPDLDEQVRQAEKELEKVKIEPEVTDVVCEKCGRKMIVKYGPKGKFLGCPGYPECVNAKPYLKKIGVNCPVCGKELVERRSKKGRKFYGCEGYPDCDFSSWQMPVKKKCPKCGSYMVRKGNKIVCASDTCGYSESSKNED